MAAHGPGWNVSAVAQVAGLAALGQSDQVETVRQIMAQERPWMTQELTRLNLRVFPGQANFILFQAATDLFRPLLDRGILIRSGANFVGLDDSYWRIGLKGHADNVIMVDALTEVLRG
jgi:threonine-phosphate decarboxylase